MDDRGARLQTPKGVTGPDAKRARSETDDDPVPRTVIWRGASLAARRADDTAATKSAVRSLLMSADAALEALAPFAPAGTAAQAQALHRPLVIGVSDERRQLIGLRLREHDSFADALAATEPFWQVAPQLAPTHWQRCAVRQLRCLCLLELSGKAVPAALLLAEQARVAAV